VLQLLQPVEGAQDGCGLPKSPIDAPCSVRGGIATVRGDDVTKAPRVARSQRIRAKEALRAARFSQPRTSALVRRGPPTPGAPMVGSFGLFLLPRGHPRCFFLMVVDPVMAEEEEGSMAPGVLSLFLGNEVALGASGVKRRMRRPCNLKRVASVETSCPSMGIGAMAKHLCGEETRHHDGLTDQATLHRPPLRLANRGSPCVYGLCIFTWPSDRMC
jgi:hypothetical protein